MAIGEFLLALLFIFSSGIFFNDRFRQNRVVVLFAGSLALIGSYFLMIQIINSVVEKRLAETSILPVEVNRSQQPALQKKLDAHRSEPASNSPDPRVVEIAYWQSISSSGDAAQFAEYLRKYPKGEFAELARIRIKELKTAETLPKNNSEGAEGEQYVGNWANTDLNTRALTRVYISQTDDRIQVRAFGKCVPVDCDWGSVDAEYRSGASDGLTALFNSGFSLTRLDFSRLPNGNLAYHDHTQFTDNSGRAPYDIYESLQRLN